MLTNSDKLKVGLAQISPIWLNTDKTLQKVIEYVVKAAEESCDLVCFGETLLPGYPFWIELTDGAKFNSSLQKEWHSIYLDQSVDILNGDLSELSQVCKENGIAVVLGCLERGSERGSHSVYASAVYLDKNGIVQPSHRKLMPTYEERLSWAQGDGYGLRVYPIEKFKLGMLNCWENWMPLVRSALYGMGEDLHIALWPGGEHNTNDITRFIAKESRSYVLSISGLFRPEDVPNTIPDFDNFLKQAHLIRANGASCIAAPDGTWLIEPVLDKEVLLIAELDHKMVRAERQNFDPSGHYSRPDVTELHVKRERQSTIRLKD